MVPRNKKITLISLLLAVVLLAACVMKLPQGLDTPLVGSTAQSSPVAPAAEGKLAVAQDPSGGAKLPTWFNKATPVANHASANDCPPPWGQLSSSALLSATLDAPDLVLHMNVSRDLPSNVAFAGRANETNVLVALKDGIKSVTIYYDGSSEFYPQEMTQSQPGCALDINNRGSNWPTTLTIEPDVFVYNQPYGIVEQTKRWPDKVYALEWVTSDGADHTWVNPRYSDRSEITAELWWLDANRIQTAPTPKVQPTAAITPTNAAAPAPTAAAKYDSTCAVNGILMQGEKKNAVVCGYTVLKYWYPDHAQKILYFLVKQGETVVVSNFNGTVLTFDHAAPAEELKGDKGSVDDLRVGGGTITGNYTLLK